ncbi:MAG TPA: ATP-binding protein [Pyrinomonadaceae bacterium]|nr:ATP-binding protein [Pyrinomonadaceae bacterium]
MELKDRVEQISAMIRELREAAGDGPRARRLLDSLFRTVHSFKAAAAANDLADVSHNAHEFENLLHSLRTGKLKLDEDVLTVMDETAAGLLRPSEVAALDSFNQVSAGESDELRAEFAELKDDERHRAAEAIREGSNLYVMEAVFDVADFDRSFRELREQLEEKSEIISTAARMEDAKINFRIFYAAKSAKIPVQTILRQAVRAGESIATALGKEIAFVAQGEELLIEERIHDSLSDALLHLVRNAVDHGIESRGTVILKATTDQDQIQITVTDDGRGIDPLNLPQIFQPGFSTAKDVTELSGRGVGLDVVKTVVENLGGSVSVTSEPAKGSSFKIIIPNQSSELITPSSKLTTPNPSSDA